jgi:hypothetical protein
LVWFRILLAYSVGRCEVEAGEVAGSAPVEGMLGEAGIEAQQVGRGGGDGVFEVTFPGAAIVGLAQAGGSDSMMHGAFDTAATPVFVVPDLGALGAALWLPEVVDLDGGRSVAVRNAWRWCTSPAPGGTSAH